MKQLTAILLALLLCVSMVPAFALELEPVESAAEVQSASDSGAALQAAGLASNDKAVLGDYPYIADGLGKVVVYNSGAVAADKIDYIDASIELASYVDESKPVQETWPYGVKTGEGWSTADIVDDPAGSGSKVICVDQRDHKPATHNAQYKVLYDNFIPKAGKYVLTYDLRFPADQAIGLYITARFIEKDVGTNISSAYLDAHRDEWLHFVSNPFTVAAGSTAKLDFNAIIINTIKYYLKNFTLYYYPANSFMIDDGSGLQLIEKAAGDTYTFPQADGIWVSGGDSYNPGDTVPVSLLEYKTFTLGEMVIENDGKTPGLNIVNGKTVPLTFDEEEAAVPGFTAGNATGTIAAFEDEGLTVDGNANAGNVYKITSNQASRYMHFYANITLEANRPYYYEFDIYSNRNIINGTGNECLWIISGNNGGHKDHGSSNGFGTALQASRWYHANSTATYNADQSNFHIQADALLSDGTGTLKDISYYLDNVLVVPYYKVTYISDGAAAATAYLQPAANGAVYDTLTLDLSKTVSKTGYRFLGWSLTPSSSVADAPATVAAEHKDIALYAVFEEVKYANVTFMDGGVQVAQKALAIGSAIEGVYSSTEYLNFQGWSTTPDGANIITTVPDTDIILYAAYDEIELETEYGDLIYYTDFSGGVTTGTRKNQGGSEYGYHEAAPTFDGIGAAFQSRSERASFAIASDPAGTGNPVVKVTENGWGYPRPSVTFNQVLTDPGIYTVSFRIFVPADSTNFSFYTYADTYNNDNTGPNIWDINRPRSFSPTLGAWTTVVGTYRVPEDLGCLGVIGLLDDRSPSTTTYYLDDVAVYYQSATAPTTSADASIRLDTPATTGIRFRASITPRLREISTEYGFIVARKPILDAIGKTNTDLTFDLTDDSVTGKKLFISGAAFIKDENGTITKDLQYSVDEATGDVTYTGVCVGISESYYKEDLVARPYAKLTVNGASITVYGDSAQSSLYSVAKALQEAGGSYYEEHKDTIDAIVAE